jgi:two-component system, OmpR family, sensor kinase
MTSIRRRLLVWLLLALGIGLAGGGGAVYLAAGNTANDMADLHLRQIAGALPSRTFSPISVLSKEDQQDEHIAVQIWDRTGKTLYISDRASSQPPRGSSGFATVKFGTDDWRVYNETVGDNVVQVAQPVSSRTAMAARMALRSVWPLLVVTPFLALAIWLTVRRGLAPLERIAHQVEERSAESLVPLPDTGTPDEVKSLVAALNRLLGRLGHAFDTQRAFVADAAHELRTPIAALKLQTQLAERAGEGEERRASLATLHTGIDRAAHLVQQLLDLARQEENVRSAEARPCALDSLAREAVGQRSALAIERGIDLGVARADALHIHGDADSLRTLIGNLIDNAINYTPRGGRIDVETLWVGQSDRGRGRAILAVADNGPGIPPEHRERVFDRFYRVPGTRTPGSGLGLAIVQSAALAHQASIHLEDNPGGGLRVEICFPLERVMQTS